MKGFGGYRAEKDMGEKLGGGAKWSRTEVKTAGKGTKRQRGHAGEHRMDRREEKMEKMQNYLTDNDCYKAAKPLRAEGIVVHSTGVDQKRIGAYTSQWNRPGVQVCVHGFLGLDENGQLCYEQTLPYDIQCWGAGGGSRGSFNQSHIQFEICESLNDGQWCAETYAAALEICADICESFGIAPEQVVTHSEAHAMGYASNHADVMHWWPRHGFGMDGFRKELGEILEDREYTRFKANMQRYLAEQAGVDADEYAAKAVELGVSSGIFSDGDGDGKIDAPRAWLKRQELAAVLMRLGLLKKKDMEE